jgi:hypothetical protein
MRMNYLYERNNVCCGTGILDLLDLVNGDLTAIIHNDDDLPSNGRSQMRRSTASIA